MRDAHPCLGSIKETHGHKDAERRTYPLTHPKAAHTSRHKEHAHERTCASIKPHLSWSSSSSWWEGRVSARRGVAVRDVQPCLGAMRLGVRGATVGDAALEGEHAAWWESGRSVLHVL